LRTFDSQAFCETKISLRQHVGGRDLLAEGSAGNVADGVAVPKGGAARGANDRVLEVRSHVGLSNCGSGILLVFQGPLLNGAINLTEIVDASIHLGSGTSF